MALPRWLTYARTFNGLAEYPGPATNPTIASWLKGLKAWWSNDSDPWCGTFVAHCLQHSGISVPKNWFRALDWTTWGFECQPCVGAICVKKRAGGGHVFFAVGVGPGMIYGYGGNQGDKVCTVPFKRSDIIAFRWPLSEPTGEPLPQLSGGITGGKEA